MRRIDYHTHTIFSPDAKSHPEEHIKQAIKEGLDEICFTDHNDFGVSGGEWELDADEYFKVLLPLKEKYKDQIKVKIGVEIGLDMKTKHLAEKLTANYPFDFVIGSIHSIDMIDIALDNYFVGKSKHDAHLAYFNAMKECVREFDCFDVLGHLDYVRRYGPYENKDVEYEKYQDIIDEVYKTLIRKGKGIEINLSGFKQFDEGLPNYNQVKRYYDLGGRILTMGTDSHIFSDVARNLDKAFKMYGDIGFEDVSTFTQRIKDK